jgi:4-amino-4-deoxy-L-arabinose transferase-like glycosyltransferase
VRAFPVTRVSTALAAILIVGAALRLTGLASYPFEQDERYTVIESTRLFDSPLKPGIEGRPLYYFLQHALFTIAPDTPAGIRALPFLFGMIGLWLTWRIGNRVFGVTAGLVGALLAAISPWHLHASGSARYYALVYVLAAAAFLALLTAYRTDRSRDYLAALVVFALGSVTHPTFFFPLAGAILAVTVVDSGGRLAWRWPSRRAWRLLWIPYATMLALGYAALRMTGSQESLRNFAGRGLLASMRLLPAMVEWMTPTVFVVGLLGGALAAADTARPDRRRWGVMVLCGCLGAFVSLLAASTVTDVYADYGMSMLPLLFVSGGGLVQIAAERSSSRQAVFAVAATAVICAGVVPSTVSHLSDGTRFDYRPAYRTIAEREPNALVLTWPMILQRYYAPALRAETLTADGAELDATLREAGRLWAVVSVQRYGIVLDRGDLLAHWLADHCRLVEAYERPRLDYRRYRVELHWCEAPASR